ncbi:MAG: hypothetical protein AABO58_23560 [Acidobacteriota bacterium]
MRRHRWLLYPSWILFCAALVFALRNSEDPSRRRGRILSNDAAARAVAVLRQSDGAKYRDFEAVHVAWERNRWIVLCDRVPHTALREAVVLELDGRDGRVLGIRKPIH